MPAASPSNIRTLLLDALNARDPADEQGNWHQIVGEVPLWSLAAFYCQNRHHDLAAFFAGYDKSGESVVAMIEALKKRAAAKQIGPPDPEIHVVPDTRAIAWVWRTKAGARPVVLERAPRAQPEGQGASAIPEDWWYWPDQWRQVRATEADEYGGVYHLELHDRTVTWEVPPRQSYGNNPVTSFSDLVSPCSVPGCNATTAECGHPTMAQAIGGQLPVIDRVKCGPCSAADGVAAVYHAPPACDPADVGPCEACGHPLCREKDGPVCRSPGCKRNPSTALPYPNGSPEHVAATRELEQRYGGQGPNPPAEVGVQACGHVRNPQLFEENPGMRHDGCGHPTWCHCHPCEGPEDPDKPGEAVWCSVCAGADPQVSDLPGWGHHPHCPLAFPGDQDPRGPIYYDSTTTEPNNGWTNTPVPAGDPRIGTFVNPDPTAGDDGSPAAAEAGGPGLTSPSFPASTPVAGSASQGTPGNSPTNEYSVEQAQQELKEEGYWEGRPGAGGNLDPATGTPWPAGTPGPRPEAGAPSAAGAGTTSGDSGAKYPDGIAPDSTCGECGCNGVSHDHRDGSCAQCRKCPGYSQARCMCGCAEVTHSRPDGSCSRCACVQFRAGKPVEIESKEDRAAYEERRRVEYVQSLDMSKVTKQRTAKLYAQCQLCKRPIMGPKKKKGKITTPGEEWVGPKPKKKGKTISMRHRSHLACADEALEELKEKA